MQHSSYGSSALCSEGQVPLWLKENSPYGPPWSEVIEHKNWLQHFPQSAPFEHPSRLGFMVLRRKPEQMPQVLRNAQRPVLDSPLAEVMDCGPQGIEERLKVVTERQVRSALVDSEFEQEKLLTLLSPAADKLRGRLLLAAARQTKSFFGVERQLYAPLYLSNACTNRCSYCGFSFDNDIERLTLSLEEAEAEAALLQARGFNSLLLLTGESPRATSVEYIAGVARSLRSRFSIVGIEVYPVATEQYTTLHAAGVNSVTLYQETYDPKTYRKVHQAGRKRDMLWRLDAPERALQAGIARLGMGALLGLAPWRFEALALGLHLRSLQQRFRNTRFSISFPRITPAEGAAPPPHPVSDTELLHMMAALRLCLPDVEFVLSTRESPQLRNRLAPLLVSRLSAGSSTAPGGYGRSQQKPTLAQFSMFDERSADEVRSALRKMGLSPVG